MRGHEDRQSSLFVIIDMEARVPMDHPLRAIKQRCEGIFHAMRADFNGAYSPLGRPSIPPEQLLKALLLQALFSIRSESLLMQQIDYNLLFRWFLNLSVEAPVWTPESFSMNRERFREHGLVRKFFDRIVGESIVEKLASADHFTVDGTLIQSWASLKSLQPKEGPSNLPEDQDKGNPTVNFHGQRRTNETHQSTTDPESQLMCKGTGKMALLSHSGHVLMENRNGLIMDVAVAQADGHAEREQAKVMIARTRRRHHVKIGTLGTDCGYDDGQFLRHLESCKVVPHVPIRQGKIVAKDANGQARRRARRRMKTKGYGISQRLRKRVEEIFGWLKTSGQIRRTSFIGRWKIELSATINAAAYNLLRLVHLLPAEEAT